MENMIYAASVSRTNTDLKKIQDARKAASQDFKAQIQELAKTKTPREMTLVEYRQYLQEKINKMTLPFSGQYIQVSVEFSDMALVMMKNDPELEEMVLEGIWHELKKTGKKEKDAYVEVTVQIFHMRENRNKDEDKAAMELRRLRKKRLEIFFEKRAEHRKDYTEFLETGKRYALPCPAAEWFAAVQSMGNFLGM